MRIVATALNNKPTQRILVCDDERHVVRLIQVNLERQGYIVVCASHGDEAIHLMEVDALLERPSFDMIVLDVMMPRVDGYEVLRWIRTHNHTEHMHVILMIHRAQDREIWERRVYRADKYLVKPFNPLDIFR